MYYKLVLGNSRTGKTTYAKTYVKSFKDKGVKVLVCDPNREWSDLADVDVGPTELFQAITKIAKPLLFERKEGILVIEDIGLTLQSMAMALFNKNSEYHINKCKEAVKLILENAAKYRVKVMIIAHRLVPTEIDETMWKQFDTKVVFATPLTRYGKVLTTFSGLDPEEVEHMKRFNYFKLSEEGITKGVVERFASHVRIENDRNFQVRFMLKKLNTNAEKVAFLKIHLSMTPKQIADTLDISLEMVYTYCARLRKWGLDIPHGNRKNLDELKNLLF